MIFTLDHRFGNFIPWTTTFCNWQVFRPNRSIELSFDSEVCVHMVINSVWLWTIKRKHWKQITFYWKFRLRHTCSTLNSTRNSKVKVKVVEMKDYGPVLMPVWKPADNCIHFISSSWIFANDCTKELELEIREIRNPFYGIWLTFMNSEEVAIATVLVAQYYLAIIWICEFGPFHRS